MKSYDYELKAIERRRWQLWALAFTVILAFAITVAVISYWSLSIPEVFNQPFNFGVIRIALIAATIAFCIYIFEKEIIFWRVSRKLINEKVKYETLDHEVKQVEMMLNASKAVNSTMDVKPVLDIILKSALGLLRADEGSIMLYNNLTGYLDMESYIGNNEEKVKDIKLKPNEGIAGKVFKTGKPRLIQGNLDNKEKGMLEKDKEIKSSMCTTLNMKKNSIGVINVSLSRKKASPYSKRDIKTLSIFAEQAASAIENARLFEKTKIHQNHLIQLNKELKDKNISLKQYVRELKKANNELERFNDLIVNRELTMIRLKEKIKKLESAK